MTLEEANRQVFWVDAPYSLFKDVKLESSEVAVKQGLSCPLMVLKS